eukprot:6203509-Pleurochrysis_carterae.AAC.1
MACRTDRWTNLLLALCITQPWANKVNDNRAADFHETIDESAVFGGGILLAEAALKTTSHFLALYKKRRASPYLTASEKAQRDAAKQATPTVNIDDEQTASSRRSTRKRTARTPSIV